MQSRMSCTALAASSRLGFTLLEVCVALAIFLIGTTALLGGWNFFIRYVADERMRLDEFYDVNELSFSIIKIDITPIKTITGIIMFQFVIPTE